jgi:outer membrane protein assembly factor BamB
VGIPLEWTEEKNVEWKCALPEWGNSTPAILGDAIFLTSHEGERLLVVKISKKARAIEWTREVGTGETPRNGGPRSAPGAPLGQKFHATQNLASPSPVTDGEVVAVHYGNGDLAAYDFAGNRLWKRNLQADYGTYTIWWGHANSPVLHEGLLISVCMQDALTDLRTTPSPSYLVAHDKKTGEEVWKTPRMTGATSEPCDAYTTPLFHETPEGIEMVVVGGTWVDAYAPATGKRLWHLPEVGGNRTITGPTIAHGMLYFTVGMRGPINALRLGGKGEIPSSAIVWRYEDATPDTPSPVVWGELLFMVSDGGTATCLDARTGERLWRERLKGDFRASPLASEGRIYFTNMKGATTVVSASREFRRLAGCTVDDTTIASLAVSDGRIYLRGHRSLYCIR